LALAFLTGLAPAFLGAGRRANAGSEEPAQPEWVTLGEQKKVVNEKGFYADVMNHNPEPFKSYGDRPTTAHETTHGIHSYLRNKYSQELVKRVNGFYVGHDRAVILEEADVKKSAAVEFIPKGLQGDRYKDYIEEQKDWEDTPLYIFDEWVAYVNCSVVALEDVTDGKSDGLKTNLIHSCVEMAVYATALGMAVEKYDREYFRSHPEFRTFLAWHLKRSLEVYRRGARLDQFTWRPEYFETFKSGADAQALRDFLHDKLGLDLEDLFG
jgi:hypothetical protein